MSETSHFQFYGTFEKIISYIPENEQLKFYKAFVLYGLYGEVPNFDGKDMAIFCQVKFAIDNQKTKNSINSENGKKGGKPTKANESEPNRMKANESEPNRMKANESEPNRMKANESEPNRMKANESEPNRMKANESKPNRMKANESENDEMNRNRNEYEKEFEHEHENSQEAEFARGSNACAPPDSVPKDYGRQVFDLCAKIGVPNCNNNFINFIQRDFKLALDGIRELKLHGEEVLCALENYGEVLKLKREDRTWWERDLRLDQLCSGRKKLILNFLPDNFKIADYAKEKPDKGGGLPEDRIRI